MYRASLSYIMLINYIGIIQLLDQVASNVLRRSVTPHCSSPLGISRNSINVQVGFTVTDENELNVIAQTRKAPPTSANTARENSYIQVEFERPMLVSGIVTQGSPSTTSRVTHFKVTYSKDCAEFKPVLDKHNQQIEYIGNLYVNSTNTIMFDDMLWAKCVRVHPTKKTGDETALRFELLGCDRRQCQSRLTPSQMEQNNYWKKYIFDKEKIISSVQVTVPNSVTGVPVFILASSRTCNFQTTDRIEHNGKTKVFTMEPGSNTLMISEEPFPVRAQCFAVFSPDPSRLSLAEVSMTTGLQGSLHRLELNEYHVTFSGCDALEPHDVLDSCGKTRISRQEARRMKRVVGGASSRPGEWPWLVSLHFLGPNYFTNQSGLPHLCGGSLIHPQWVLSAAHCFDDFISEGLSNKSLWMVVLGEHYVGTMEGTEQIISVEDIVKHPDFKIAIGHKILYDIVLVKLSQPASLSDYVNTICLEPGYEVPDGSPCLITGWGMVEEGGVGVALPNTAELKIVPQAQCADDYNSLPDEDEAKQYVSIEDSVMCARADLDGIDACKGDSGGPLMCYHDNHWMQAGIVSFGYACGDIRYPGVYTNVNYFYGWIASVIENDTTES